jgi:hypothetical protein
MTKYKSCLIIFLLITFFISLFTFSAQTAGAEIAPGITVPSFSSLQPHAKLHDPFKFMNGTRLTSKNQWEARRQEISALVQTFEYGIKPPKPQTVTDSFSSNALTVNCSQNGKSISFKCSIQYPTTGKAPYPAMIGVGMSTLDNTELLKLGVAIITFPCEDIASNATKATGLFYNLYGTNYNGGSFIAWAWGVSRMIDALEITPSTNIDPKRLGVTGGSRYGKGALCVGAFDERIALTVPQEGGVSSSGSFRIADASGKNIEKLPNLAGGTCWMAPSFTQFQNQTNKLPFDTHMIHALVAPRPLLLIENPDFEWLYAEGDYQTAQASHMIYEGLGVPDKIGFSSVGGHGHCQYPASQLPELRAYIQKFLIGGGTANTNINRIDKTYIFDKAKWVDWTIPDLAGPLTSPSPINIPSPTPTPIQITTPTSTLKNTEDINNDGVVNMADVILIATCFNAIQGDTRYDKKYDLNSDGVINMSDVIFVALKFGKLSA